MLFVSFIHTDREGLYNPEMMVFSEGRCFEEISLATLIFHHISRAEGV